MTHNIDKDYGLKPAEIVTELTVNKVRGNTYYLDFGWLSVPYYQVNEQDVILLDSGLLSEGEKLAKFFKSRGQRVVTIVHSHVHTDHVNGDVPLIETFDPVIYCSFTGLEDAYEVYEFKKDEEPQSPAIARDLYRALTLLMDKAINTDGISTLEVCGHTFTFIDTPGHCIDHKLIITPDEVCYLGDSVMYGATLENAKLPYSKNLREDIKTMESLKSLTYRDYLAAHEGYFFLDSLEEVCQENLDIFYDLIKRARSIKNQCPNLPQSELNILLEHAVGLNHHADVFWIIHTVEEVFKLAESL